MELNLSPEQSEEVIRCATSPEYFVENFCWLQQKASAGVSAIDSIIPFTMGERPGEAHYFQREILRALHNRENTLTLKSRRVGCSWIGAAYAAWLINFHPNVNVMMISQNGQKAKDILAKVRFILKNLAYHDHPDLNKATRAPWLLGEIAADNQERISIAWRDDDGEITVFSEVLSLNNTDNTGRGSDATFIIFDELAFYEHPDQVWASALITLTHGGHWLGVSTPNGIGDVFHRMCMMGDLAEEGKLEIDFKYIKIHWSEAGITEDQIRKSTIGMTEDLIEQEWEFRFIAPGQVAFDPTHLATCYKPPHEYPEVAKELAEYRAKVNDPSTLGQYYYYGGADSAVGKAHRKSREKDWNAFTVLTKSVIQAYAYIDQKPLATWAGKVVETGSGDPASVMGKLAMLHRKWPGFLQIEEDGPGYTVVNNYVLPDDTFSTMAPVSMKSRMKRGIIDQLIIAVESHQIVITDLATYQQMSVFQRGEQPGTFSGAPVGYNDDLVMALAMAYDSLLKEGAIEFPWGDTTTPLKRGIITMIEAEPVNLPDAPRIEVNIPTQYQRFEVPSDLSLPDEPGYGISPAMVEELLSGSR